MKYEYKLLVIIPARKDSTRCPGKNTRLLGGIPLINWTLNLRIPQTIKTGCVSTDIKEILDTCEFYRYDLIKRPNNLCKKDSTEYEFIIHALNHYKKLNIYFDDIAVLYPTTPFKKEETLIKIFNQWANDRVWANQLRTVKEIKWEPEKIWYLNYSKSTLYNYIKYSYQDHYKQVPYCYIYKVNKLNKDVHYNYQPVSKFIINSPIESYDINTKLDFWIAEQIVQEGLIVCPQ